MKFFKYKIRCSGRRKCLVKASVETFGDVCASVHKYLEVHYLCDKIDSKSDKRLLIGENQIINLLLFY